MLRMFGLGERTHVTRETKLRAFAESLTASEFRSVVARVPAHYLHTVARNDLPHTYQHRDIPDMRLTARNLDRAADELARHNQGNPPD